MISPRLALAVAEYLCHHRSVGLLRLTLDMLKDPKLHETWKRLGVDPSQIRPGDPLLFKAVRIIQEHVEYLEQHSVVRYIDSAVFTFGEPRELLFLPNIQVVNWVGKPCGSPTPPPTSPPFENSTPSADGVAETSRETASAAQKTAGGVQKGGRKRQVSLADFL